SDKEVYLNIELHNLTKKDTVSLFINDCVLYKGKGLTYNTTVGQIDIFPLHKPHKHQGNILKLNTSSICAKIIVGAYNFFTKINDGGMISLVVNQLNNSFPLNLDDGKYIKFDKLDNNKFIFKQSHKPF
ncbi:MAG: hypothetical protein ABF268_10370, partial [Polaribacter sp.]